MPKTISAALKAHKAGTVTTLATCWYIQRRDGVIQTFTEHDQPIEFGGRTYKPTAGYVPSAVESNTDMSVGTMDLRAIIDHADITDEDMLAGVYDYAFVQVFEVNYMDLTQGSNPLIEGRLGELKMKEPIFEAELRDLMAHLSQGIGENYLVKCQATLGDARCQYVTTDDPGEVDSFTSQRQFTALPLGQADHYYDGGILTWVTGLNAGYTMDVKTQLGDSIELYEPMPNAIQIGDTFTVVVGCDRFWDTCKTKFNNQINFRGFPHLVGITEALRGP